MIRGEHDPVSGGKRSFEALDSAKFDAFDSGRPAKVTRKDGTKEPPPQLTALGRYEPVGFCDDDILHAMRGWGWEDSRQVAGGPSFLRSTGMCLAIRVTRTVTKRLPNRWYY